MASESRETEFTGRGRQAIAAGLLASFDRAKRDQRPVWISLEAPTGWGKTRIAKEFYRALAQSRQTEPAYWPPAISTARSGVSERRKSVNPPDFEHVSMSRPDFVWWGVSCGLRNGTPTESLLQDVTVLRKHIDHLENAWWYRAGFVEKFAYPAFLALRAKVLEDGVTAAVDFGVAKAGELVGGALPGFAAMSWLIRKGVQGSKAARTRSKNLRSVEGIVYKPSEVDEVESFLAKIAPLVPVVLLVEDVHDADDLLVELIERLIVRDAPVMIVTTGWPGFIDAHPGLVRAMRRAGERLIRLDEETSPPPPFPPEASLRALTAADLASIVESHREQIGPATRDALVAAYPNPFALELVLETYGAPGGDVLEISLEDIERLSGTVADIHKAAWSRLGASERERLTLATLAIPALVSGTVTANHSWDRTMVERALALPGDDQREAHPSAAAIERTWVRSIDEFLCEFHDVAQMNVAATEFTRASDRLRVRSALIEEAKRLIADRATPVRRSAQASRLLLAYRAEIDPRDVVDATRALVEVLADLHEETGAIARLGDDVHSLLDLHDRRDRDLLWRFAQAERELGHHARAIELLEELLDVEGVVYGDDSAEVLATRRSIASSLAGDGRQEEAVDLLEEVLARQLTTRADADADVLDTQAELALTLAGTDRLREAVSLNERLLVTQATAFGDESPELAGTRRRLAEAVASSIAIAAEIDGRRTFGS
ncbi:tetratricopeptide repeat protein [Herbiconiux sp. YIM B11900]|uniref:tetratricopeptide repeat protein n=1 Tax=Herbiconiux sp. YIM B11900 TaxID=3404131 RepID=UPI003F83E07B